MHFLNRLDVIENVHAVPLLISGVDCTAANLRDEFFSALNEVQSSPLRWEGSDPLIEFENDQVVEHLIQKQIWKRDDTENNAHLFPSELRPGIIERVQAGMDVIGRVNPDLLHLIKLTTANIPCLRKPGLGGGSISSLIGTIWLNPQAEWDEVKYGEVIFHEWVHHSLFLEDMVRGLFTLDSTQLESEEALVTSAILRTRRSLDKSYNSAAVTIALMYYYHRLDNEQMALSFLEPTRETVEQLEDKKQFIAPRGQEILSQMSVFLAERDYEAIGQALSSSEQLV